MVLAHVVLDEQTVLVVVQLFPELYHQVLEVFFPVIVGGIVVLFVWRLAALPQGDGVRDLRPVKDFCYFQILAQNVAQVFVEAVSVIDLFNRGPRRIPVGVGAGAELQCVAGQMV